MEQKELFVWDTELTVLARGKCTAHIKTKESWRVSDGRGKPEVRVIKTGKPVDNRK